MAQRELRQIYPATGWVEHDPEEIWEASVSVLREAAGDTLPAAIGIANQRETVLLWDRASGACLHNAIVWQDRRTAPVCDRLRADGREPFVAERSGLLIDPYFSATKLAWLLDALPGARERSDLAFGTIDSFLVWRLTGGRVHATDATNAARTNLFDIHECAWSPELLALFDVPESVLPEVRGNAEGFGTTDILGAPVPVAGMAGDQQAATLGQGCLAPATSRAPMAPAASCWPIPAQSRSSRATGCLPPSRSASTAGPPTRSKAPSSLPERRCNGCATDWA